MDLHGIGIDTDLHQLEVYINNTNDNLNKSDL